MKIFIENCNGSLRFCLNVLRWIGFLVPDELTGDKKKIYPFYCFTSFMFINGIYVITQTGGLIQVWGNLSDMTNASFLLFSNLALTTKVFNVLLRRKRIQNIIDEGDFELRSENREEGRKILISSNNETTRLLFLYAIFASVTVFGLVFSAEKLPLPVWYPYDASRSPVYELTYTYQCLDMVLMAVVNVSLDQLVTSLTAVCRCRLKLLNLSLRTLGSEINITDKLLTPEEEAPVSESLRRCVLQHQSVLEAAAEMQVCFAMPILVQFAVSLIILCTTAYQLAVIYDNLENQKILIANARETNNSMLRLISMSAYLMGMILQVFLYCYQGNHLSEDSGDIADAAYECPWYSLSAPLRRSLTVMMARSRRVAELTAGGFATLSLHCFMSIIKASYSFFTVLQQMEE